MIVYECQECGHEKGEPSAYRAFTDELSTYCPDCESRQIFEATE